MKTVTELRQSSAHNTFIAESVYLVLNSFLDWKPVEKLKQRCDVDSFIFFQYEANSTVLYAMKALDRGSRPARKERIGRHDRMSEVASFTVASVERYFWTELIRWSWW